MPIIGNDSSGGKKPTTPVIGTAADDGTGTTVSVPFTPSTYIGKSTITYTALSSPGSLSATSSGSPITVTGLTTGTAYTFTVTGNTNYGVTSDASGASNSVIPTLPNAYYESIASTRLTSNTNTITLSSIPGTYKHLQVRFTGFNVNDDYIYLQTNLTGTRSIMMYGSYGTKYSNTAIPGTYGFEMLNAGIGSSNMGSAILTIHNYASPVYKQIHQRMVRATETQYSTVNQYMYLYESTAAITSITIRTNPAYNLAAGTTVSVYGIKV